MTTFTRVVDDVNDNLASYHNELIDGLQALPMPDGYMTNGMIQVTVASNNITLALKTKAGTDPSSTDPVTVWIAGTKRQCTAALSVTKNAGTNWFNSGAAILATKEIDYFAYLIWNTTPATDIMDIGFARVPYGNVYSDFSGTSTAETYLAFGNASTPTSTDNVAVIGRFAATLSASASYNWSVPTYTNTNLKQYPIFHTRSLSWVGAVTAGAGTPTTVTSTCAYQFDKNLMFVSVEVTVTNKGTASGNMFVAGPMVNLSPVALSGIERQVAGVTVGASYQTNPRISMTKYDGTTTWVDGYVIPVSGWVLMK